MKKNPRFQMRGEYEKISESCCTAPEDISLSDLSCLAPSILMIYPSDGDSSLPSKLSVLLLASQGLVVALLPCPSGFSSATSFYSAREEQAL